MRLLQRLPGGNFQLISCDDDNRTPQYAILSHTWSQGEVTYHDLINDTGRDKTGFKKLRFCSERAAADGLEYFWVDTCCIDKSSSNELSTAINSMFKWYQRATKCYVYLSDVTMPGPVSDVSVPEAVSDAEPLPILCVEAFRDSRWFKRGWTLQELIAPASVEFFSSEGHRLGSKTSLEEEIQKITQIPVSVLGSQDLSAVSVSERMSWTNSRQTTIPEDKAYCLFGIFGVFLPLIYGEGEAHARRRLEEEIQKRHGHGLGHSLNFSAGRLDTARPTCVVPFRRDPDFVDGGTVLDDLQKKCLALASRVALVGLGGVGKSQLAIEHCYRTVDRAPDTWIFWVHAGSAARLEQSYRDMANQVELPDRSESQANMFELMRSWLLDEKNGAWLLVLDNADDAAVFRSLPGCDQHHLSRYLPLNKHGSVVVTSRSVSVVSQLVEEQDIFNIVPMHEADAQNLLKKKLGDAATDGVNELAVELEYMPLALVQAATYISKRRPHYSVQQYLEEFRKNDKRKASLLKHEAGHVRRDEEAKNSIIITWQISFEHIWRTRRSAADLLSLMSFFDRQGIPKALLLDWRVSRPASEHGQVNNSEENSNDEDDSASDSGTNDDFFDDVLTLGDYSFVSQTTDPGLLEMHSLIQLATQKWLQDKGELANWRQQFVSTLSPAFPTGEYENWDTCRPLFPHAMRALDQRPQDEESGKEWATLMYNAARYAWERGDIEKTERLAIASVKTRSKLLGAESDETLESINLVGEAYREAGRWTAAEELHVQAMEASKVKLGVDHLNTLTYMNNLALTYWYQGRYKEAEELQVQVLETRKAKLGVDHPDMLQSMGNLALIYWNQGRWEAAEELEVQVLETRKAKLGADHPDTLKSMRNLAVTWKDRGRDEEAIALMQQCVQLSLQKLGATHHDTKYSMGWLSHWESTEAS